LIIILLSSTSAYSEIPRLAYKIKPLLIKEVRFWWSFDEPITTFAAQIHAESNWDQFATSPVGAQGLAQFMPKTADWISGLYPELKENAPYSVSWSVRGLVIYDKWCYVRINSMEKWPMTLSAYNGGLTWLNRDRELTGQKQDNPDLWFGHVEKHSKRSVSAFAENRSYVKNILCKLLLVYRRAGF